MATKFGTVDASPTKAFFVEMLTRDITLEDAILDLLDNCLDGLLRSSTKKSLKIKNPYKEINFDKDSFSIDDNCGGIPWSLHEYAFRMGRPRTRSADGLPTVGAYGIGMKRAIFKIGKSSLIQTKHKDEIYDVEISTKWIEDETWNLEAVEGERNECDDGTSIIVGSLHTAVAKHFSTKAFQDNLISKIESHYALIISKGFTVLINGIEVSPKPICFHFQDPKTKGYGIRPYMFETEVDGVSVFVSVGLREPVPSEEEVSDEQEEIHYSKDLAGWSVICNDRVVLYCNKDEETGWGEAGVPKYHNQFIAISGVVEFSSSDASLLPTTTTKRGIEHSSALYAQVKNRMREGLKIFTNYTNDWKSHGQEAKNHLKNTPRLSLSQTKEASKSLKFTEVRSGLKGKQYKPKLPQPSAKVSSIRVSFTREREDVEQVSRFLFGEEGIKPSEIGNAAFDRVLSESE